MTASSTHQPFIIDGRYLGEFQDGVKHGHGTFFYADGSR